MPKNRTIAGRTKKKNNLMAFIQYPVSYKVFSIVTIIVSFIAALSFVLCHQWDPDTLWEIAQGREILQNGIPYTDALRILPDMSIVVQQWLYDAAIALFDELHSIGHILFQTINCGFVFCAGYLYLSQYKIKFEYKLLSVLALMFVTNYTLVARPEGITIFLLIMECYAFERFKKTNKWKWLLILPAGMLLEANVHMSMIWMHLLFAVVYIVPSVSSRLYITYNRSIKLPILFSLFMIPCMFVNPYGINGVMYLPYSYFAGTFNYTNISETEIGWTEALFFLILAGLIFVSVFYKKKRLYSSHVYIFITVLILTFIAKKNIMFMVPAMLCISAPFLRHLTLAEIKVKLWVIAVVIAGGMYCTFSLCQWFIDASSEDFSTETSSAESLVIEFSQFDQTISDADAYIREKNDDVENVHLFAGFNNGAYFEYLGYRNVYMDARPELRMKIINRQRNELIEYMTYTENAYYTDPENITEDYLDIMRSWISDYQFDYMVVDYDLERSLATYMKDYDTDYHLVFESDWGALYERNA